MLLYKEDSSLIFKYYDIYNDDIQNSTNLCNSNNINNKGINKKDNISKESYFTIEDIKKSK